MRILVGIAAAVLALAAAGSAAADVTRSSGTNEHEYMGVYVEGGVGQPVYQTSHDWMIVTHPGSITRVGSATYVAEPSMVSITAHWAYTQRLSAPWSVDGLWWVSPNGADTLVDAGRYVNESGYRPFEFLGAGRWDAFPFAGSSYIALVCAFKGLVATDAC